jgi:uncharacterized protein DUF2844
MRNAYSCVNWALLGLSSLLSVLLLCLPAFAVLGEDVSTVRADGARMKSAIQFLPASSYSIHAMRAATGTVVREFVSPGGEVFGVAWQGPYLPDLRQLLGEHFEEYMRAAQNPARVRSRMMHLEIEDMVFESGGHMRFFVGRAYLRSKLPDGVTSNDVR